MRVALTAHDFGDVFRMLNRYGLSQRHIAVIIRQSQPEVSNYLNGWRRLTDFADRGRRAVARIILRTHRDPKPVPGRSWLGRGRTRPVHQATNAQGTPAGPATAARHPGCGVVSANPTRTAPHHHPGLASPAPGLPAKRTAEGNPSCLASSAMPA